MKNNLMRGLFATSLFVLAFSLVGNLSTNAYRQDVNRFLGTSNYKITIDGEVSGGDIDSLYPYKSDYSSTKELVQAFADVGERMGEEGTVLLKNENNCLPLDANHKKVTLLGTIAYNPYQGGQMGSGYQKNVGTDADTVSFVNALKERGFEINKDVQTVFKGGNQHAAPAASLQAQFQNKELSVSELDSRSANWKDSFANYNTAIVVFGRNGGENASYLPGLDGVSEADKALHQSDPLGLNDNERDILKVATDAKKAGKFDKVIVILNTSSTMEIKEIKENEDVDAMMMVGVPGGYGFRGVVDVMMGADNLSPSGHLTDTFVTKNSLSPAAQNYSLYKFTNYDDINAQGSEYAGKLINSYLVEAEGIYTGYYYYETRYEDAVRNRNNADSVKGSVSGAWKYENEVVYPFGYGLSYTTFEQKLDSVEVDLDAKKVKASITVKNTGSYSGKSVAELYVHAPYIDGGLEKASIRLIDFGKTKLLAPNESEVVNLEADLQDVATWDSSCDNGDGTKGSYVLDAGKYYFALGNGAHEALNNVLVADGVDSSLLTGSFTPNCVQSYVLDTKDTTSLRESFSGTKLENQLEDADLNYYQPGTVTELSRSNWDLTFPKTYDNIAADAEMLKVLKGDITDISVDDVWPEVKWDQKNGLTLLDLKDVPFEDPRWGQLIEQLSFDEALKLVAFGGVVTQAVDSIGSPQLLQNDGPNGINNNALGHNVDAFSTMHDIDPYYFDSSDKNFLYKGGCMALGVTIAQTFNKELSYEQGKIYGNYAIWAHVPIHWSCGLNTHRSPYNARNHEYYSEDGVLGGYLGANMIRGGREKGFIISPKHYAFNDTELNRSGVAPFMSEQKARQIELRSFQIAIEKGEALGIMTSMSRIGATPINAHEGVMYNVLRKEWGFHGLNSTDAASNKYYFSAKECAINCVTMTTQNKVDYSNGWEYFHPENLSKAKKLQARLQEGMKCQYYAAVHSNAINGYSKNMKVEKIMTWYDMAFIGIDIGAGLAALAAGFFFVKGLLLKKEG